MKIIRCPDCNSARIQYIAVKKNLVYLQSELTQEWYTPNLKTKDIQADPEPALFRCVKCDNEWVGINDWNIKRFIMVRVNLYFNFNINIF